MFGCVVGMVLMLVSGGFEELMCMIVLVRVVFLFLMV